MLTRVSERYTEYNVARLGLISVQSKLPAEMRRGWQQEISEGANSAGIRCLTGHESGIPHGLAGDVLSALITETIAATQNGGSASLRLTAADLARSSGLPLVPRTYERMITALYQLRYTNYQVWDKWVTPLYKVEQETVLTLLPELGIRKESSRHFPGQQTIYIEAQLHPTVVASINGTLALATDPAIMHELSSPTARGLYRVLEAARRDPNDMTRMMAKMVLPAREIAEACRLLSAATHLSRLLEPLTRDGAAFDQLLMAGYLKAVDWIGWGENLRVAIEFQQDGQLTDTNALRFLHEFGVVGANAETLATTFNRETIECAAWLVEARQRKRNDITNPQGLLIKLLRDGSATQSLELFRNRKTKVKPQKRQEVPDEPILEPTLAEALTAVGLLEQFKNLPSGPADQLRHKLEAGTVSLSLPRSLLLLPSLEVIRRLDTLLTP